MNRNFCLDQVKRIMELSLKAGVDLLPYLCVENFFCCYQIARSIRTIMKYDIVPEVYWHGNEDDYKALITLLADDFPSKSELLRIAREETAGRIREMADHFYQKIEVMFDLLMTHAGYVVLKPTEFMLYFFPDVGDMLYIYTTEYWNHKSLSDTEKPFLVIHKSELDNLSALIKKRPVS